MKNERKNLILALQLEKEGNWDRAHQIVQVLESVRACLVHAYLHRKEGDRANADYWYHRAGEKMPEIGLNQEWQLLYELME